MCSAASHTGGGGHHAWLASGPQRIGGVLTLLNSHNISVVGIQEFQPNQRAAFQARARGWSMYPGLSMGRRAGENSVAWRTDTWEMVKPGPDPDPLLQRPHPADALRAAAPQGDRRPGLLLHLPQPREHRRQHAAVPQRGDPSPDQPVQPARRHRHPAVRHRRHERARRVLLPRHRFDPARLACRREQQRRLSRRRGPARSTGSSAARTRSSASTRSTAARWSVVRRTTRSWSPR